MASSLRHGQVFSHAENELTQPSIEISPVGLKEGHQEPERSNISLRMVCLDRKDVWCVLRISWNYSFLCEQHFVIDMTSARSILSNMMQYVHVGLTKCEVDSA